MSRLKKFCAETGFGSLESGCKPILRVPTLPVQQRAELRNVTPYRGSFRAADCRLLSLADACHHGLVK